MSVTGRLKTLFISGFLTVAFGLSVVAGVTLFREGWSLGWAGVVVANLPVFAMIMRFMVVRDVARTSDRLPLLQGSGVAGVALAAAGLIVDGALLPLTLAVVGLVGVLLYVYWYSRFGREHSPALDAGRPLAGFSLFEADGAEVPIESLRGQPALLLFYRGSWCPLCMAQIQEVVDQYQELERRGVQVVMVSNQPPGHTRRLAERFDVGFRFLVDRDLQTSRQLGIYDPHATPAGMEVLGYTHDSVLPTVVITDAAGQVLFAHETDNYRVRPEPALFLEVLDAHREGRSPRLDAALA